MVIVTTVAGGHRSGCLVGFHTQCSIDPPRYAVWLSEANHTCRVGAAADHFAVHWVPSDRHDLAELFGGTTGDEVDKFDRCDWTAGPAASRSSTGARTASSVAGSPGSRWTPTTAAPSSSPWPPSRSGATERCSGSATSTTSTPGTRPPRGRLIPAHRRHRSG